LLRFQSKIDELVGAALSVAAGEGADRHSITLPGQQQSLCEAVIATGKPTVLVVIGGGSISIDFAKDSSQVLTTPGNRSNVQFRIIHLPLILVHL
jgi:putative NADH-flavin reductase